MGIIRGVTSTTGSPRRFALSAAEWAAVGIALAVLLLHAAGIGDALDYRRELLATQPWRIVTAHLVHINWAHAAINVAALVIVARLFAPDLTVRQQLLALSVASLAITAALALLLPGIAWYRGLSGVLHALFFAGATKWLLDARPRDARTLALPLLLVIGGWIKVATEQPRGEVLPHADWLGAAVVPQAHLTGALVGSALGLLFALTQRARQRQTEQQQQRR